MEGSKLSVVVSPYTQRSEGPNGRQKKLSIVTVKVGSDIVATRTMPGTWSPSQALGEFRRFPERFKRTGELDPTSVATLAAA